jgi:hypothetical protein
MSRAESGKTVGKVVLVRTPSKLSMTDERLTMVQGDAANLTDVERVIQGTDAVLSVLGHVKGSAPDILTHAIRNIITVMDMYGVKRLVSLSGSSIRVVQDKPRLVNHLIKFYTRATTGSLLQDGEQHVVALRDTGQRFRLDRCAWSLPSSPKDLTPTRIASVGLALTQAYVFLGPMSPISCSSRSQIPPICGKLLW